MFFARISFLDFFRRFGLEVLNIAIKERKKFSQRFIKRFQVEIFVTEANTLEHFIISNLILIRGLVLPKDFFDNSIIMTNATMSAS